jgi:hypothetical protein
MKSGGIAEFEVPQAAGSNFERWCGGQPLRAPVSAKYLSGKRSRRIIQEMKTAETD